MTNAFIRLIAKMLLLITLVGAGVAMAQSEPSMGQIYATAQAGKLDEALGMVQQVLVTHPKSAKAHFVQAELYSRQGKLDRAREALSAAEKFAPGLPFAKPEAVQSLRSQLAARPAATRAATAQAVSYAVPQVPAQSNSSWLLPLLLTGGVIVAGYFLFRRRVPEANGQQPGYANQNGLSGPQSFGAGGGGGMQPAYAQPGYQQGYPQQGGTGIGGRIMGGVATGLAVGAGVMAAEAIGRNLMGGHNAAAPQSDMFSDNNYESIPTNTDMGGSNFGISDTSWDDGGSADMGGGGDWDN